MIPLKNSCDAVYSSLDVRFTKNCDNACEFCIEKRGLKSLGKIDIDKLIKQTINSKIRNVLILGGEPFLYPEKLYAYVVGIRSFVDTIYITTSLPSTFLDVSKINIIYKIIELIDGLNISINSIDSTINNKIFDATHDHNRLNILKKLNKKYADKIRVSLNLVKGGVDDKIDLELSLAILKRIKCKYIKINELQNSSKLYISYEDITEVKLPSPYYHGCQTELKNISDSFCRIILKRSCFIVEKSRKASFKDLYKILYKLIFWFPENIFKVLYEDGSIYNEWRVDQC